MHFNFDLSGCVYISYFPDTEKATHSVLNLAARLKKHALSVKMDALCQREIDDIGKPIWYQSQLEAANKIILVISKGYLKVRQCFFLVLHSSVSCWQQMLCTKDIIIYPLTEYLIMTSTSVTKHHVADATFLSMIVIWLVKNTRPLVKIDFHVTVEM